MTAALPAADSSTPRLQRPPGRSPSPVAVGREPHPPSFCPPGEVQMFSTSAPRTPTAGRFARFNPAWPKWTQRGSAAGGDQSTPGGSSASRRLSHTEHNCLELPGSQKAEHVGAAPRGGRQPGNTARLGALVCYLLHHLVAKANSAEISRRSCSWTRREASLCQLLSLPPAAGDGDKDAGQHPELCCSPSPKPQPCTKPPLPGLTATQDTVQRARWWWVDGWTRWSQWALPTLTLLSRGGASILVCADPARSASQRGIHHPYWARSLLGYNTINPVQIARYNIFFLWGSN